jgi:predicted transcriptional regulator
MSQRQLHKTQVSILHSLRYAPSQRFSDLMRPTEHMSDTFKFHLRKLAKLGYIEKQARGEYKLTNTGKEFANILDENNGVPKKQPKLSVFVLPCKGTASGKIKYLLHKRVRNPFIGYWTGVSQEILEDKLFIVVIAKNLKGELQNNYPGGVNAWLTADELARQEKYFFSMPAILEDAINGNSFAAQDLWHSPKEY